MAYQQSSMPVPEPLFDGTSEASTEASSDGSSHRSPHRSELELSVIIPTRNEEANIPSLLARIDASLSGIEYEVVVVDASDDDTPHSVEREILAGRPVRLICRRGE